MTKGEVLEGQRASDSPVPVKLAPRRDQLLEAVIAHQQIAVVFQPQIDPKTGAVVGTEALARWSGVDSAERLFERARLAGLDERLSRLVQRKALRAAAAWEGPLRRVRLSINRLPADLLRSGYSEWLIDQINASIKGDSVKEQAYLKALGVRADYVTLGQEERYQKLYRDDPKVVGWTYSLEDFSRMGIHDISVINLPWRPGAALKNIAFTVLKVDD